MEILNKISSLSKETRLIAKHIGLSTLYKAASITVTFFLVPLSITFLGNEKYGLWLTIFSFIGWFNFFDFGMGHGLRNKLTEVWAIKKSDNAKRYISTAYYSLIGVMGLAILIFLIIFPLIHWEVIFQTNDTAIKKIVLLAYIIFISNMVLSLISVIFFADQKASVPDFIQLIGQLITLISIYLVLSLNMNSLLLYAAIVMGSQSIVFLVATVIAFGGKYHDVRPSLAYFDKKKLKDLFQIGGNFFFIQIAGTLLFTTDNFIINYFFSAKDVTMYNIAFKYFMIPFVAINIISAPYWSAFTDAYHKGNEKWIKDSLRNLIKISLLIGFGTIIMILLSDVFYVFWVGDSVEVPFMISIIVGINTILIVLLEPFIMFINGTGKLKIQLYTAIISACINIVLSIFLSVNLELGVSGVVLASLICTVIGFTIYPIQVKKILNNSAKGIWNS